jgi:effector-binding domain-containing protein
VEPEVIQRSAQPYVSITNSVRMDQLSKLLPPQIGEIFGWLAARGVDPAGPPLWKYNVIDMAGESEIEVGVPTAEQVSGDSRFQSSVLPAGRYAFVQHVGRPDLLEDATRALLEWAEERGLSWDIVPSAASAAGVRWVARVEEYLTDPVEQPDMKQWQTNLIFKLAD